MNHARNRVLLVEDDITFRKHLHLMLDAGGFDVSLAWEPEEARQLFSDTRPSIAIIDVMLPPHREERAGLELCRWIRRRDRSVKLVVATVRVDDETLDEARRLADDVIVKTHIDESLVDRLRAMQDKG